MGGADPARILSYCDTDAAVITRDTVLSQLKIDHDKYEAVMARSFAGLNAAEHPAFVDPGSVLIVEATEDHCMPPESRDALWQAMGRPELITIDGDHNWAFLAMTPLNSSIVSDDIVDFLQVRFGARLEASTRTGH